MVKNRPANAGDASLIPRSGRFPGEGNGNPLQCSCLENPRDGGAWWAAVYRVAQWLSSKESTCQCRRCKFDPWVGKSPWRRAWQPTPSKSGSLPHGNSLVCYTNERFWAENARIQNCPWPAAGQWVELCLPPMTEGRQRPGSELSPQHTEPGHSIWVQQNPADEAARHWETGRKLGASTWPPGVVSLAFCRGP